MGLLYNPTPQADPEPRWHRRDFCLYVQLQSGNVSCVGMQMTSAKTKMEQALVASAESFPSFKLLSFSHLIIGLALWPAGEQPAEK